MTLGPRWTTRIIVLPGAPLVSNGPYRFVSHPNYLVVVGEIAALPLCLGLPWIGSHFLRGQCDPAIHPHPCRDDRVDRIAPCRTRLSANTPVVALASTSIGFAMMCVGMFMAILDVQVVATSLPTIQSALDIPPDQMSWVQTAYLIAEVVAIPLTGFLTRLLSMCWLFVLSVSVFTLASVGCAASDHFPTLIAWRVLQGFSGGTLIPASLPRCSSCFR